MLDRYRTVYSPGEGEIEEKKSRFLAHVTPVHSEEEAAAFIEKMKKKFWDARHNCYAYRIGEHSEFSKASDDGEPSGTAGRPMLDVLTGEDIHDVCVVVTRYFGGTLLGTGGLVRAYSQAVQEGLKNSVLIEKILAEEVQVVCGYGEIGKIQYLTGQLELVILDTQYTENVLFRILVPKTKKDIFEKQLTESFAGTLGSEKIRDLYYARSGKDVLLFES